MEPDEIRTALREVIDPEVGINVVDLGLVYGLEVTGQLMLDQFTDQAESAIRRHCPDAASVAIDLVWDPPWSPERMSEGAKRTLGW